MATALHQWLPLVLHYVEPWLSKSDIDAGDRWGVELAKELTESNFGISCVTKDNLTAPWLLFEAGAIAKSVDAGKLIPLLLDIDFKDVSGPLTQFQAKKVDRQGVLELVISINNSAASAVPDGRLTQLFDALWPELEAKIASIPAASGGAKVRRSESEILEELVSSVRAVDSRVRDVFDEDESPRRRRRFKAYPMMLREVVGEIGVRGNDPVQLVIIASFFKDEIPWLYELAVIAYRSILNGEATVARSALRSFQRGLKMIMYGPLGREFGVDRERIHMLSMEVEEFVHTDLIERFPIRSKARGSKPSSEPAP